MVLHTLRYVMGEAALRTLLRQFANPNGAETEQSGRFRHVTTTHFVRLAEEVSGRSLEAFFEVYLYRGALPVLETTRAEGQLRLRWTNTGDLPFAVPVPVRVDGHTRRVSMRGGTGTVAVPDEAAVEVDPAGWILRAEGSR
jgi:aminopeptidase N